MATFKQESFIKNLIKEVNGNFELSKAEENILEVAFYGLYSGSKNTLKKGCSLSNEEASQIINDLLDIKNNNKQIANLNKDIKTIKVLQCFSNSTELEVQLECGFTQTFRIPKRLTEEAIVKNLGYLLPWNPNQAVEIKNALVF